MKFRTRTGSIYELDKDAMTITRVSKTERSGKVRGDAGKLIAWPVVEVGREVIASCEPLDPGTDVRIIHTSKVEEIL